MNRQSIHPIILIIVGLAGFGFIYRVSTDPLSLVKQILTIGIFVAIFYAIYKLIIQKHLSGGGNPNYRKAVRQSKQKNKQNPSILQGFKNKQLQKKKANRPIYAKSRKNHNLTVIEGKKNKKKNRALF